MQNTEKEPVEKTAGNGGATEQNHAGEPNGAAASAEARIQELEAQLKEKDAKYLYLYAEFENYKKRSFKELQDARKFGWENVARDLILVLDNLERAMAHVPAETDKNLVTGLQMVIQQFKSTLQRNGAEEISTMGKAFDPNVAEAVAQEASAQPAGIVIQEHLKGYMLHGRLLRPARVVVSSGPAQ